MITLAIITLLGSLGLALLAAAWTLRP